MRSFLIVKREGLRSVQFVFTAGLIAVLLKIIGLVRPVVDCRLDRPRVVVRYQSRQRRCARSSGNDQARLKSRSLRAPGIRPFQLSCWLTIDLVPRYFKQCPVVTRSVFAWFFPPSKLPDYVRTHWHLAR